RGVGAPSQERRAQENQRCATRRASGPIAHSRPSVGAVMAVACGGTGTGAQHPREPIMLRAAPPSRSGRRKRGVNGNGAPQIQSRATVNFSPVRPGVPTPGRQYVIIRQLPAEGGERLYRVKSKAETFERIAKKSELA